MRFYPRFFICSDSYIQKCKDANNSIWLNYATVESPGAIIKFKHIDGTWWTPPKHEKQDFEDKANERVKTGVWREIPYPEFVLMDIAFAGRSF